jgi:hypothetical protein
MYYKAFFKGLTRAVAPVLDAAEQLSRFCCRFSIDLRLLSFYMASIFNNFLKSFSCKRVHKVCMCVELYLYTSLRNIPFLLPAPSSFPSNFDVAVAAAASVTYFSVPSSSLPWRDVPPTALTHWRWWRWRRRRRRGC